MTEEKSLYEKYGLKMNPFPLKGSFPLESEYEKEYAKIFIGREKTLKKINKMIEKMQLGEILPVVFLTGEYGYGKTHALKYIQYVVMENYQRIIPLYIKNIGEPTAIALYKAVIDAIDRTLMREHIYECAKRIMETREIIDFITKPFPDFREIIPKLADEDIRALRWLFAEELSVIEKDHLRVVREIRDENASDALISLIRLLYYGGNQRRFLFLIDELESVIGGESLDRVRRFYEALRNIIDKLSEEAMFIFSATPIVLTGHTSIRDLHPALLTRIKGEIIQLRELTKEETKKLIASYLDAFREPKVRKYYERLYPFTEEAIEIIYSHSKGVPREILRLASIVLYEAARRNLSTITGDFVSRIFSAAETTIKREEIVIEEIPVSEETAITVSEILEEEKAEKESLELKLSELERKMYILLRKSENKSAPLSLLAKRLYIIYEAAYRIAKSLERKGVVLVKPRGKGYRIFLRV